MTEQEYRNHPAISRSDLWHINQSPLHFRYAMDNQQEATKALIFGQAVHKFVLEGRSAFFSDFAVAPIVDRRTKVGKETYADFLVESKGKTVISHDEYMQICDMELALKQNKDAVNVLCGIHEQEFFWVDEQTSEHCKCRVDCLTEWNGKKYVVDYKTTASCVDGDFERSGRKYGYKFQAGMYCEGVFQNTLEEYGFIFVAQEKTQPYATRIYVCSPEFIASGYDKFRELIGIYHQCKTTGNWYGYEGPENMVVELTEEE